jgi:hypothetical protein
MQTEMIALADLRSPERNVRVHPDIQIIELAKAVDLFGQTRPLIVDDDNTVLVGNGLLSALRSLGHEQADVLRIVGLTASQKTKLMLSDNKIFNLGMDDHNVMLEMIRELDDLSIPGFDEEILRSLTAPTPDATRTALDGFGALSDEAISGALARNVPQGSTEPSEAVTVLEHEVICPKCGHVFDK